MGRQTCFLLFLDLSPRLHGDRKEAFATSLIKLQLPGLGERTWIKSARLNGSSDTRQRPTKRFSRRCDNLTMPLLQRRSPSESSTTPMLSTGSSLRTCDDLGTDTPRPILARRHH